MTTWPLLIPTMNQAESIFFSNFYRANTGSNCNLPPSHLIPKNEVVLKFMVIVLQSVPKQKLLVLLKTM